MFRFISFCLFLILSVSLNAQISGNQAYQSNRQNHNPSPVVRNSIQSTDSTLVVHASIMLHQAADYYELHIGVKQSAKSVQEANEKINNRIKAVVEKLKGIGTKSKDVYVDFISEIKVYDFAVEANQITEFLDGFEVRKNLIVKVNSLDQIDSIIDWCADVSIYDIIKVEYYNENQEKIYNQLFDQAIGYINKKKDRFLKYSSVKLSGKHRLVNDNFKVFHPKNQYKQYNEAFESSTVTKNYSSSYTKKEIRKERTFYFEGLQNSQGADLYIDTVSPQVGIQYHLSLTMIYEIER